MMELKRLYLYIKFYFIKTWLMKHIKDLSNAIFIDENDGKYFWFRWQTNESPDQW